MMRGWPAAALQHVWPLLFGVALWCMLVGGAIVMPEVGLAAPSPAFATAPRRPPIIPPSVPVGAPESWAYFTYVEKINQAWGRDWPFVIRLFREYDRRYPGNAVVHDKLYAAHIEFAKELWRAADLAGARRNLEAASAWDPTRGEAEQLLDDLVRVERGG